MSTMWAFIPWESLNKIEEGEQFTIYKIHTYIAEENAIIH